MSATTRFLPFTISKFPITARNARIFAIFIFGIFMASIWLLLSRFDMRITEVFQQYHFMDISQSQCKLLNDPLAILTLSRMRNKECTFLLEEHLCEIGLAEHWPVNEVNNGCGKYFDDSKRNEEFGCFNSKSSNLKEYRINLISNSPENCVQICLRASFSFAAVTLGTECFCGNIDEITSRPIENSKCDQLPCSGNASQFCGGVETIRVFWTGVQGKHIQNLPKLHELDVGKPPVPVKDVKILFLFQLNGRNARQIRRLLRTVYSQKHLYLVHVDSRQHFLHSEMLRVQQALQQRQRGQYNFRVFERRLDTIWGGTNLLELFLRTIADTTQDPMEQWRHWDYLLNLSEADMPLLALEELEYNLARAEGKSFLSSHGYNTATFLHKQGFNFLFTQCEGRMWRVASRNYFPRNLRLDGGSDWVVVHRDLALYAISSDPFPTQMRQFFSTVLLPLESFFHTLSLNSEFCERVLYRNLRFTNWRRRQGCRCAALKPVVDWCGCSPLALRSDEVLFSCQEKSHFFGRKFDSLVDIIPMAFAEQQALRFSPNLLPDNDKAAYNATWINLFAADMSGDSPFASKLTLLNTISEGIIDNSALNFTKCKFHRLLAIHVYKENSTSSMQSIFTTEVQCGEETSIIEALIDQMRHKSERKQIKIGNFWFNSAQGIEFGIGFDLKEEIFRVQPPLVDMDSKAFTLKWHWIVQNGITNGNQTSPSVALELTGTDGAHLLQENVGAYDSVNGNQFVHIRLSKVINKQAGTWTASLFGEDVTGERLKISETKFRIFSRNSKEYSEEIKEQINSIFSNHFTVLKYCTNSYSEEMTLPIPNCSGQPWSTFFPDEKSSFPIDDF